MEQITEFFTAFLCGTPFPCPDKGAIGPLRVRIGKIPDAIDRNLRASLHNSYLCDRMFGLRFNRLPKHRTFSYKPLYYDEDKERLDAQVHQIKRELGQRSGDASEVKANISRAFRAEARPRRSEQPLARFYTLRILFIAGLIGFAIVKLSKTDLLTRLIEQVAN